MGQRKRQGGRNKRLSLKIYMTKKIKPIHPGEILETEFLKPLNISKYKLAKDISVSPIRVSEIVKGKRSITANTALRLGRYFNMSPEFWLNLQNQYDLEKETDIFSKRLEKEVCVRA